MISKLFFYKLFKGNLDWDKWKAKQKSMILN